MTALDEFYKLLERQEQERKDVIARLRLNGATVEAVEVGDILVSVDCVFKVIYFVADGVCLWDTVKGEEILGLIGEFQNNPKWVKVKRND